MATPATNPVPETDAGIRLLRRSLAATAWVAGGFAVLVCAVMVFHHFTAAANDPWKSPQLLALKARLGSEPKNEPLKVQIRQSDLAFRRKFRDRLALDHLGGWLLAGGAFLLAVTARKASEFNRVPPFPQAGRDPAGRLAEIQKRARWSVAVTAVVAALGLVVVSFTIGSALPANEAGWRKLAGKVDTEEPAAAPLPATAELQANSPRFRGWDGGGATAQTNFPLVWDNQTGKGIAWKSQIPAPGRSSPVVWNNEVFVSGGTAGKREVFCYDVSTGNLLWRRAVENVPGSPSKVPEISDDPGYAASTPATDGRYLYVIFATGDLAALNFDGAVVWSRFVGPMKNMYGYAASLATWQGKVLIQLDQGDSSPADSKLLAVDGATGRVLWSQPRPVPGSWASPIVIEAAGKPQIITLGLPWVIANSPVDGGELWRAQLLENEVVPSPVFAGGLVIAASPSSKLLALRPDGAGDVTKTHVAWSAEDNIPDIASPVSNGELVFTVASTGMVTCFDARDGTKVWQHNLDLGMRASPAIAGGRLFVLAEDGVAVVIEAGRQFREIARGQLPDKFSASPAFANGRVFLRGETNLFCLGPAVQPGKER